MKIRHDTKESQVVSRCRDPQLQVGKNYSYLFKSILWDQTFANLDFHFVLNNCDLNERKNKNDYSRV